MKSAESLSVKSAITDFGTGSHIFAILFFILLLFPSLLSAQSRISSSSLWQIQASPVWNQNMEDMVLGQPNLQVESAVVACAGGSIKSYYMTGTPLWNFNPQEKVTPFLARSIEGAVYVCDNYGVFRAINRVGRELWRLNLGKPINHAPVVGWDGRVFIPVESQMFCRTAAGSSLWSLDLGSPVAVAPVLDSAGCVATVLENREFVRITQFSAVEKLRLNQLPHLIVSQKSGEGSGSRISYVIFYTSGQAELISYNENASKGNKLSLRQFPSLPAAPASVAGRNDQFAVTLSDGRVLLMNTAGDLLWTGDSHETVLEKGRGALEKSQAAMVFDERGIYSLSTCGAAGFAIDGRRRFMHKFEEASSIPAFSDEGILYVCGKDQNIYAYKIDNRPRIVPRSKYYGPEPEGSYGMGNPPPSPWADDMRRYDDEVQASMYAAIESAVNSGQLGENEPYYMAYMQEMIGFFLKDPHYSRVRPAVKPPERVALIRLLGRVGSRETVPFLWNIFDKDPEPSIKAACAEAIGKIGVDPNGSTFESYNFLLAANNPNRDPQLLMSATASIAALCRFSGPPISGDGILLLRYFSNLSWAPNSIKAQIRNELDALYREGLDKVIQ